MCQALFLNKKVMINALKKVYREEMFFPRYIGIFFNPFYFARKGLAKAMIGFSKEMSGSLLDVGCGASPYRKLFSVKSYEGLEIDTPANRTSNLADEFYDGDIFPYKDHSFDAVLCNQVLEHVFTPDRFLQEIHRVLAIDGRLLLTVPFVWDEHEQPFDYARYSSFGLKSLLEKNGFVIIRHEKIGADATILFQLTNAYLFKITQSWPKFRKWVFVPTVLAAVNLIGLILASVLPRNDDLFLDHVVLAEKKS